MRGGEKFNKSLRDDNVEKCTYVFFFDRLERERERERDETLGTWDRCLIFREFREIVSFSSWKRKKFYDFSRYFFFFFFFNFLMF